MSKYKIGSNQMYLLGGKKLPEQPHAANDFEQIKTVQSLNFDTSTPVNTVNVLGSSRIFEYDQRQAVNLNFDYLLSNGREESVFGFSLISGSNTFSGQYNKELNFHAVVRSGEDDANLTSPTGSFVIGFGNCVLNSYSIKGDANSFITASVSFDCLNYNVGIYQTGINSPAVNKMNGTLFTGINNVLPSLLVSGTGNKFLSTNDMVIDIKNPQVPSSIINSGLYLNNFGINVSFNRASIESLGWKFPKNRLLTTPINVTFDIGGTLATHIADNLINYSYSNPTEVTLSLYNTCKRKKIMDYKLTNLKLINHSQSYSVNQFSQISLSYANNMDSFSGIQIITYEP